MSISVFVTGCESSIILEEIEKGMRDDDEFFCVREGDECHWEMEKVLFDITFIFDGCVFTRTYFLSL